MPQGQPPLQPSLPCLPSVLQQQQRLTRSVHDSGKLACQRYPTKTLILLPAQHEYDGSQRSGHCQGSWPFGSASAFPLYVISSCLLCQGSFNAGGAEILEVADMAHPMHRSRARRIQRPRQHPGSRAAPAAAPGSRRAWRGCATASPAHINAVMNGLLPPDIASVIDPYHRWIAPLMTAELINCIHLQHCTHVQR